MTDLIDILSEWIIEDNAVFFVDSSLRYHPDKPSVSQQLTEALALHLRDQDQARNLPEVADKFLTEHDLSYLIRMVKETLEVVKGQDTPIHDSLAELVPLQTKIITTQFDGMLAAALADVDKNPTLVTLETDLPYFREDQVTLIRAQGDIDHTFSLKISEEDIDAFALEPSMVGEVIRSLFVTKPLIFFGHDLSNRFFKLFYRRVVAGLRTPDKRNWQINRAKALIFAPVADNLIRRWRQDYNIPYLWV